MRRGNFIIVALVALGTYLTLSALIGRRNGPWERNWRAGHCQSLSTPANPATTDSTHNH